MSKSQDTRVSLCGNCKHFVAGGLCELVKGQIKAKDTCDLHAYGHPQPIDTEVEPTHNKLEVNYKPGFMVETITEDSFQMYENLINRGISHEEAKRATIQYFSQPEPPYAIPWPGPVTGLDLVAKIEPYKVVATREPLTNFVELPQNREPYPTPNVSPYGIGTTSQPYPSFLTPDPNSVNSTSTAYEIRNNPTQSSANWVGTASDPNSQPSIHGEHGFTVAKSVPEWRYPIEDSQVKMPNVQIPNIIIPPSGTKPPYQYTAIQEAITQIRQQFGWLTNNYVTKARELAADSGGKLYLIRAAGETITDHRSEGEEYRRKLSADELNSMTRTAIGKNMDINHQPEYETDATILDAEFDKNRKEIQMLVIERDPQINDAISNGKISAVSINGGMPRSEIVEPCDGNCTINCELCNVPQGVVLGELDQIAMTWVVTDPNGMMWKGQFIDSATPGIKNTIIEIL